MKYLVISFALFLVICPKVEGQNYATGLSQEYLRSAVLDAQQNFYLFWNYTDTHITFEVIQFVIICKVKYSMLGYFKTIIQNSFIKLKLNWKIGQPFKLNIY